VPVRSAPQTPFEVELQQQLETQRAELNWLYSQLDRPADGDASRAGTTTASLYTAVREHEATIQELTRQFRQCAAGDLVRVEPVAIADLQRAVGQETALVEYFSLDGELLAFLVTDEAVEVVRGLGREAEVEAALQALRFQLDALRYGIERVRPHLPQLTQRARHHLASLFDLLLRPLMGRLGTRRLVVVPHRMLYYVPFHALYDGDHYVLEGRDVCSAPSAGVLHHCLALPRRPFQRAVLLGVADARTPGVRDEVRTLAPLFRDAVPLLDEHATLAALQQHAPTADVLHLACHGRFRADNPLFSAVRLADGWLTVYDAYALALSSGLVTLSACETGVSGVAPGDELLGLARGFFSAGAPSLLVSLWTADDETTTRLMQWFYAEVQAGATPAAALRQAQRTMLGEQAHPFFWAPFVLLGRW